MELKDLVKNVSKQSLYERYYLITGNYKDYEKITRYQLITEIYNEYNNNNTDLINKLCSTEEMLLLKKIYNNEVKYLYKDLYNAPYDTYLNMLELEEKGFLNLDILEKPITIANEIQGAVAKALTNFDERESRLKDELNFLIIGIIRTHFMLSKDDFYKVFSEHNNLSYIDLNNYIKENIYFEKYIMEIEVTSGNKVYYNFENAHLLEEIAKIVIENEYGYHHVYKEEEYISIGKCWFNLTDKDILKIYNLILTLCNDNLGRMLLLDDFLNASLKAVNITDEFIENMLYYSGIDDIDKANDFLQEVLAAINRMPKWINQGVSPFHAAESIQKKEHEEDTEIRIKAIRKIGRNDLCHCGSGKKYKKCCLIEKDNIRKNSMLKYEDSNLFYKLFINLCFYVNKKFNMYENIQKVDDLYNSNGSIKAEYTLELREKIWESKTVIDDYIMENPDNLNQEELNIIKSWEKRVTGNFILCKFIDGKAILFDLVDKLYEISGIISPISENFHSDELPVFIETTLLPFNDRIVYDTFISSRRVQMGPGIIKQLEKEYEAAESNIIKKL